MSSLDTFQSTIANELQDQGLIHGVLWRPSDEGVLKRVKEILLDTLLSLYPTLKSDTGTALFARREHKGVGTAISDARDLVVAHLELLESVSIWLGRADTGEPGRDVLAREGVISPADDTATVHGAPFPGHAHAPPPTQAPA